MEAHREAGPALDGELGPDEAKALLNRWGREGFFRAKGWGDRITVTSVRPLPFYVLTLETQYERRGVETRREPWGGGAADSVEPPPGVWEVAAPAPDDFETGRSEITPIPHTDTVVECEGCGGLGRLDCPACGGTGRRGGGGCPGCGSRGWVEHGACSGTGRFREYRAVVSHFTCGTAEERLFSHPLPEGLLKKAGRETLIDYRRTGGGFAPPDAHPEMGPGLEGLWESSVPKDPASTRILFQRYRVERVKGWEVAYEAPAGRTAVRPGRLWIIGDGQVVADRPLRAWGRLLAVGVPAAALTGWVVFALASSLIRSRAGGAGRVTRIVVRPPAAGRVTVTAMGGGQGTARARAAPAAPGVAGSGREGGAEGGTDRETGRDGERSRNGSRPPAPRPGGGGAAPDGAGGTGDGGSEDADAKAEPEEDAPDGYEVIAGIYSDANDAAEAVDRIEDTAYEPTVKITYGPGETLRVVSVQGFESREEAEEAARELREKGVSTQTRIVPIYETPAPPATAPVNEGPAADGEPTDPGDGTAEAPAEDASPAPADSPGGEQEP
jgi:hypothetical protein